ncbi:MAG: acyl-CoA dehydrogenase family protein [Solirubrobacterales bacterium]
MARSERAAQGGHKTQAVTNQSVPLQDYNVFTSDRVLRQAVRREGGDFGLEEIERAGELAGRAKTIRWGFEAEAQRPKLETHDRFGDRIDEVSFHPAYHELMKLQVSGANHALPWRQGVPGAHVARAASFMCMSAADAGTGCPVSMTYSAIPALRMQPEIAAEWEPRFASLDYDPRMIPATEKTGAMCGMAMTEKQGGSDVRTNTTAAVPLNGGGPGAEYELTGHKWFCSAPMCDAFLVLAQTDAGPSCFFMPRFTPDGDRNRFHLQRLKDKLGNHSNASSEVEFDRAWARLLGEEGRGVATIIEMVNHTRLDCVLGSTAGTRFGLAQAIWHTTHRSAFGKPLIEQPLMRNVLADLAIESEAATVASMWLARQFDEAHGGSEGAAARRRLATPVLKYWICKRAPYHAVECLECFGGNGYVEDSGMPRLFRESPLQSIWEGSGNVQALDVLRAMVKSPAAVESFFAEVEEAVGADKRLDRFATATRDQLADLEQIESRARRIVERMALALQASLLIRFGDEAVADAFCATRLEGDWGFAFGTLPSGTDVGRILDRHTPAI